MLSRSLLFSKSTFARLAKKSLSINTPCLQAATDPIQKLFVDKINEYAQKSKFVRIFLLKLIYINFILHWSISIKFLV